MLKKMKKREFFDTIAIKNGKKEEMGFIKSEEAMGLLDEKGYTGLHINSMAPVLTMEGVNIWFDSIKEREEFIKEYFAPSILEGEISLNVASENDIEIKGEKLHFQSEEALKMFLEDFTKGEEELAKTKVKRK